MTRFSYGLAVILRLMTIAQSSALIPRDEISDFQQKCLSFVPTDFVSNSSVDAHEFVSSGTTLSLPGSCTTSQTSTVNVCRIALNISTSDRSSVIFEAWLPLNYSGRFLATGNGGIDGCIKYADIDYGTTNGFAAVGSNNGHNGTGGLSFFHNDEVLQDYVYRSLHTITEFGKSLTNAFYGSFNTSYYLGCSGGGRQGVKAAEMFPEDYDGIVVGAPAVNFNNMSSWRASFFGKTGANTSADFISADVWSGLIHDEVIRQCDTIDGVADGIIEDPELCDFNPVTLQCGNGGISSDCLTPAQVAIVQNIFTPLYGASGELVYPAMQPGSEIFAASGLYDGQPWPYSLDWFRYVVYSNPDWDDRNFSTADISAAQTLNPFNVQTWPVDLNSFSSEHNGKMLLYHGQQDNQISSFNTPRFWHHLADGSPDPPLDSFLRFFRISGMAHCSSGPGAWMIGQATVGATGFDPASNVLAAMVRWVEMGVAPESIQGTKYVNDTPADGVAIVRNHCRYPLRNTYIGGNASLPESWSCVAVS